MNTVQCVKLDQELEALDRTPYPGELGKRILASVSKQGWQLWLDHQTMLINENNLNMLDEKAQSYLKDQMEKFFFSEQGADDIQGYTPSN
mgnify:CR=1 FL=1